MNHDILSTSSSDAEFHLRVRQAMLFAQTSARQFGLLLIQSTQTIGGTEQLANHSRAVEDSLFMQVRNALRDSDTIMQLPNRALGVLLPFVRGIEDVELIIWRILGKIEESLPDDIRIGKSAPIIGGALFPEHASSATQLIKCAEKALEQAQNNGSQFSIHSLRIPSQRPTKQLMMELRHAIVNNQLFLTYQPKINLAGAYITGVEALVRWQHPERGVIPPDEFIPVAERTGLIIPLTLWVLHCALTQCRRWLDRGLNLSMAVNLTMWNLETQELPDQINSLLRDTGVPAANLELEITESSIMGDPQRVITTLNSIRKLGVRFAIDDFGTGYSSFAYLSKLPVKSIKIDKSFVFRLDTDRDNALIVRSIIDLSHNLGLKVVAEGVETAAARDMLKSFGCDEAQGYFYSRPQPSDIITNFLSEPPYGLVLNRRSGPSANDELSSILKSAGQIVSDMTES
jgi:EAL domain-containing protein (putative c-di-GMP-specific phosphodiesterase class I)